MQAGGQGKDGTRHIRIDGVFCTEAQLVWLLNSREWPERPLHHANGNRSDSRIENLRLTPPKTGGLVSLVRLKEVLDYEPESGWFTWLIAPTSGTRKPGERAGGVNHPMGYRVVTVDGRTYKEHRLAWFYVNGFWPEEDIDHSNNVHGDNRITNLRLASDSQNIANSKVKRDSRTGVKGTYPTGARFGARIRYEGKTLNLGIYETLEEAHEAYLRAARDRYGEFARSS